METLEPSLLLEHETPGCGKHPAAVPQKLSSLGQHLHSWVYTQENRNLCSNKSLLHGYSQQPYLWQPTAINTTQNAVCITQWNSTRSQTEWSTTMPHHGPSQKISCRVKVWDRAWTAGSHSQERSQSSVPRTHIRQLTTACISNSRDSDSPLWPPRMPAPMWYTYGQSDMHTYT